MEAESVKCSVWATSLGGLVPEAYGPRVFTRYYRDILSYTSKRCASGLELSRSEDRAPEPSSQPNIYVLLNRLGARAFRTGATIPSTPLSSCQWWSGRDFVGGANMGKLCCGRKHAGTLALWPHREFLRRSER